MHNHSLVRKTIAVASMLLALHAAAPVSASDSSKQRPLIGSVSVVGTAELRGVPIVREGTLFDGDTLRSHDKAYTKVMLVSHHKLELGEKTDVTLNRNGDAIQISMRSGSMAFVGAEASPIRIKAGPFEIVMDRVGAGNVTFL